MFYGVIILIICVLLTVFARVAKVERGPMIIIGVMLALGLAGYAQQGQPSLPQSPVTAASADDDAQIQTVFLAAKAKIATDPNNADHWTTLANAMMARNRVLVPAADFAYKKALEINPKAMEAAYFYGLALAESGRGEEAKAQWVKLAAQIPTEEPRRKELLAVMFSSGIISEKDVLPDRPAR